jgi:hypothetical protein
MLDGQSYFKEFPDEKPSASDRLLISKELLVTLRALEQELTAFLRHEADAASIAPDGECNGDTVPSRDSAKT